MNEITKRESVASQDYELLFSSFPSTVIERDTNPNYEKNVHGIGAMVGFALAARRVCGGVRGFPPSVFERRARPSPTFIELGCGGYHASYLKTLFAHITLTDLSPDMLAASRSLKPDCQHIQGDMRTLRLERTFDVVFIHDAIEYMTTLQDLRKAIVTASPHCWPGGLALFVPDQVQETFQPSTDHGGTDGAGRALLYLEWSYDPDEHATMYTVEYAQVLRE